MWKLTDEQKPKGTIVFFDLGGAQAKLELLPEYKANRGETPEDFEKQVPIIKELTRAMGFGLYEENGVESDDLLAAHATRICSEEEDGACIYCQCRQRLCPNRFRADPYAAAASYR